MALVLAAVVLLIAVAASPPIPLLNSDARGSHFSVTCSCADKD